MQIIDGLRMNCLVEKTVKMKLSLKNLNIHKWSLIQIIDLSKIHFIKIRLL